MSPDIMYFITFALGMAAFWLSGRVITLLPHMANRSAAMALGLAVTALVYGLTLAVWTIITSRKIMPKRILLATVPAIILGYGAAQVITRAAAGKVTNMMSLGILTFVLFVCYGLIYVLCLALARRIAK
ncbi:MAG TPA: hypothetical protein VI322_00340 [Candidatus Saccharimonadia bacterium]